MRLRIPAGGGLTSYRRILATQGPGSSGLILRSDDLETINETLSQGSFRQLVVIHLSDASAFRPLGELKDHGKYGFVGEAYL